MFCNLFPFGAWRAGDLPGRRDGLTAPSFYNVFYMIKQEYDIVGMRWDPDRGDNLVIFEKVLG